MVRNGMAFFESIFGTGRRVISSLHRTGLIVSGFVTLVFAGAPQEPFVPGSGVAHADAPSSCGDCGACGSCDGGSCGAGDCGGVGGGCGGAGDK